MSLEIHTKFLGYKVKDTVTGFVGVVTSISFDLYGCVQAIVHTEAKDQKIGEAEAYWFDTKRLVAVSKRPVMRVPSFQVIPGGAALPAYQNDPARR